MLNVSILTIGDEICIGQVVNTNAAWLSSDCVKLGYNIVCHSVVGDDKNIIIAELDRLFNLSDIIITTGGLGPTHDDITKPVLCEYFNDNLIFDGELSKNLEERYIARGLEYSERNKSQAYLPSKSIPLGNSVGSAPGMMFERNGKYLFALPGVPAEMKYIAENSVFPKMKEIIAVSGTDVVLYRTIHTAGIVESKLADMIGEPEIFIGNGTLAFLPSYRGIRLRIGVTANSFESGKEKINEIEKYIKDKAGKYIIGYDDESLAERIGYMLIRSGKTVAVAESCTGGMLGAAFTDIPGSSEYFIGGVIAYSNEAKINFLNVKRETIEKYGAVSQQTAIELAEKVRELFNSEYGISITGIAGPGGGTDEKPVGTVWIGISDKNKTFAKNFQFITDRAVNRDRSVGAALTMLFEWMVRN